VYVDRRRRVWLLDFSALGPPADPLLFAWEELAARARGGEAGDDDDDGVQFRVVEDALRALRPRGEEGGFPLDVTRLGLAQEVSALIARGAGFARADEQERDCAGGD
jgi:hypothetical protein